MGRGRVVPRHGRASLPRPGEVLRASGRQRDVDGPGTGQERIFLSQRGVTITEPDRLAPFQDQRAVYHDDIKDYVTNEPTMDGTASAILMRAAGVERGPSAHP